MSSAVLYLGVLSSVGFLGLERRKDPPQLCVVAIPDLLLEHFVEFSPPFDEVVGVQVQVVRVRGALLLLMDGTPSSKVSANDWRNSDLP